MPNSITSNIEEVVSGLSDLDKKQIPYAASLALNKTAEVAMSAMVQHTGKEFNVTAAWNKVGGKYGIKKRRAKKTDLSVTIFIPSENTWIEDHQDASTRTGKILIPTKEFFKHFKVKTNRSVKKKASTLLAAKSKARLLQNNHRFV